MDLVIHKTIGEVTPTHTTRSKNVRVVFSSLPNPSSFAHQDGSSSARGGATARRSKGPGHAHAGDNVYLGYAGFGQGACFHHVVDVSHA